AGEQSIPSSLAGTLVASAPIWTAILAGGFVPEERLPRLGVAGVALGIVGVVLLFGVDLGGGDALLGGALILLASLGYAIGALVAKRRLADVPAVGLVASIMSLGTLFLLPALPFAAPGQAPGLDTVAALLALGLGGTGVAFLIFYILNAEVDGGRHRVGVHRREVVGIGPLVGRLLDELGVRRVRAIGCRRLGRLLLVVEELDRPRRIGKPLLALDEPERARALAEDVHPPVVEALEHARHRDGAADALQLVIGQPDDAELAIAVQALADHRLVALLEDVEGHVLRGDGDEPQREQREVALDRSHRPRV